MTDKEYKGNEDPCQEDHESYVDPKDESRYDAEVRELRARMGIRKEDLPGTLENTAQEE